MGFLVYTDVAASDGPHARSNERNTCMAFGCNRAFGTLHRVSDVRLLEPVGQSLDVYLHAVSNADTVGVCDGLWPGLGCCGQVS